MHKYRVSFITASLILLGITTVYFYLPSLRLFDAKCFLWVNKFFLSNKFGQYFWGILSHKNESWINVIVMLSVNVLAVYMTNQNKRKAVNLIIYCWLSFQLVLLINIVVFQKIFYIHRDSPSLIAGGIRLSQILNNPNIKDFSNSSFPGGHALVLIYWALFVNLYATRAVSLIALLVCVLFALPRIITGAHWLSDIVFSLVFGWMFFNLSMWFANRYEQIKCRLY